MKSYERMEGPKILQIPDGVAARNEFKCEMGRGKKAVGKNPSHPVTRKWLEIGQQPGTRDRAVVLGFMQSRAGGEGR